MLTGAIGHVDHGFVGSLGGNGCRAGLGMAQDDHVGIAFQGAHGVQ